MIEQSRDELDKSIRQRITHILRTYPDLVTLSHSFHTPDEDEITEKFLCRNLEELNFTFRTADLSFQRYKGEMSPPSVNERHHVVPEIEITLHQGLDSVRRMAQTLRFVSQVALGHVKYEWSIAYASKIKKSSRDRQVDKWVSKLLQECLENSPIQESFIKNSLIKVSNEFEKPRTWSQRLGLTFWPRLCLSPGQSPRTLTETASDKVS